MAVTASSSAWAGPGRTGWRSFTGTVSTPRAPGADRSDDAPDREVLHRAPAVTQPPPGQLGPTAAGERASGRPLPRGAAATSAPICSSSSRSRMTSPRPRARTLQPRCRG